MMELLTNEVLENTIHIHLLKQDEYAGLMSNFRLYGRVTRDVLSHWVKPITVPYMADYLREETLYTVIDDTIYIVNKNSSSKFY
jgi:hypothetical protein